MQVFLKPKFHRCHFRNEWTLTQEETGVTEDQVQGGVLLLPLATEQSISVLVVPSMGQWQRPTGVSSARRGQGEASEGVPSLHGPRASPQPSQAWPTAPVPSPIFDPQRARVRSKNPIGPHCPAKSLQGSLPCSLERPSSTGEPLSRDHESSCPRTILLLTSYAPRSGVLE